MHILLVTYEFPPEMATGGIGSYMNHLAGLLRNNNHHVTVFSATNKRAEIISVERSNCINYLIPAADAVDFRKNVLQFFKSYVIKHKVDIIESPEVGACALEIKKAYPQIPLVIKMHTPGVLITKVSNTYQPFLTKLRFVAGALIRGKIDLGYWAKYDINKSNDPEYNICEKADVLLSPSKALKDWAVKFWQLPAHKIEVVPNPFTTDAELFSYPVERHSKTICFIGKLTVLKGMFALTAAIKMVLLKHPEYRFILVGRDEPVSDTIPSMKDWMSNRLGAVADRVIFKGALTGEEVKANLKASEICVVPSLWENYPTVVLEAMAAGCTVAASNRGGIREIIRNQKSGLLFNPMKSSEIANAILELINQPELRFQMAHDARGWLVEQTNQKTNPQKYLEFLTVSARILE